MDEFVSKLVRWLMEWIYVICQRTDVNDLRALSILEMHSDL